MALIQIDPLTEFFSAINNEQTKKKYQARLALFFDHLELDGDLRKQSRTFAIEARKDTQWATHAINEYIQFQKSRVEKKQVSESTLPNYFKPIKLFCEENEIVLNWKKISRRIPKGKKYADDRAYTTDEIKKILSYPDRRIKPAVLTMVSHGSRVGIFENLDWGHIKPIKKNGKLLGAKIKVYIGDKEQYTSFITPECYRAWEEYFRFRSEHGEEINEKSPALRNLFYPDRSAPMRASAKDPHRFHSDSVRHLVEDALFASGLRVPLDKSKGQRRHEVQEDHGFRKFFETCCIELAEIDSLHVDFLEGHDTGLRENYHRGTDEQLFKHYQKAIPFLSIFEKPEVEQATDVEELKAQIANLVASKARDSENTKQLKRDFIELKQSFVDLTALLKAKEKMDK